MAYTSNERKLFITKRGMCLLAIYNLCWARFFTQNTFTGNSRVEQKPWKHFTGTVWTVCTSGNFPYLSRCNSINTGLFISVTDSPYSDRADRKESIKKLMKELSKEAEIKRTQPSKESIASVESEKHKNTAEKTKHSALRLFRTVRENVFGCEKV